MTVPSTWMPECEMERIIVHWTAGAHKASEFDRGHYHILIEDDGRLVRGIPTIAQNAAPMKKGVGAHHTLNCNTGSIGVSLCCMGNAIESPFDAGNFPMTRAQWDALAPVLADLCKFYKISVTNKTVLSHAEVQVNLGIKQRQKWDISRLAFEPSIKGAKACGDIFRKQTRAAMAGRKVAVPEDGGEPDIPTVTTTPQPPQADGFKTTGVPTAQATNGGVKAQEGAVSVLPSGGDPDVFWVQMKLQQMNYPPGKTDWMWGGKTAGAIAGFLNDIPEKPTFAAPVSGEDFKEVFPQLKPLIEKHSAAGWTRPIAEERKNATAETIPGNQTVKQTWWARWWAKITTFFTGGTVGVGLLSEVVEPVKGPFDWVKENMPTILTKWWFWAALVMVAAGAIWRATRKAEQATIDDYREGRLN